jgi:hypothetical protein
MDDARPFASEVYSNLGEAPARYAWDVRGEAVMHRTEGSSYTGTFSADGSVLSGGWRPDDDSESSPGNSYDVVMTRVVDARG